VDILLLKATDLMNDASESLDTLERFIEKNPELIIVDPLHEVKKVMDRNVLNDLINSGDIKCLDLNPIKTPCSILLDSDVLNNWKSDFRKIPLQFPLIFKPVQACGSRDSHQMMVFTGPLSFKDFEVKQNEWVVQEYLNHDAIIYKVYVIGDFCEVTPRISLPNYPREYPVDECIHFNSHDPITSNMFSAYHKDSNIANDLVTRRKGSPRIVEFEHSDQHNTRSDVIIGFRSGEQELWNSISHQLRNILKLDLFGYDVIIDSETGLFYVVDVNYFPSYKNISQFPELLLSYLLTTLCDSPFLYNQTLNSLKRKKS
jgi:inositol-1,3,4-trisphosphate 5/6-kinase/inositol-tetrakisphosphate 1-kinase